MGVPSGITPGPAACHTHQRLNHHSHSVTSKVSPALHPRHACHLACLSPPWSALPRRQTWCLPLSSTRLGGRGGPCRRQKAVRGGRPGLTAAGGIHTVFGGRRAIYTCARRSIQMAHSMLLECTHAALTRRDGPRSLDAATGTGVQTQKAPMSVVITAPSSVENAQHVMMPMCCLLRRRHTGLLEDASLQAHMWAL